MERSENDWTSQQVARFPDRLRGFGGFNPLRDYALRELARCAQDPRLRQVFHEANRRRMAIVVHMRSSVTRERPYGAPYMK
jgi:predicted TIM-barrel fold metal-dependent hydrolase